jgi:hypothetical protein
MSGRRWRILVLLATQLPLPASAQYVYERHSYIERRSVVTHGSTAMPTAAIRPGAENDVPTLAEIGWDTDLPKLFTIRFLPARQSFSPGWSSWALEDLFHQDGRMPGWQQNPWPPFFVGNPSRRPRDSSNLSPEDMQRFQDWCNRRAAAIPPIIVHSIPFFMPSDASGVSVLPLGFRPGTDLDSQRVEGVGFSNVIYLGLAKNADDYAVTVPPDVVPRLPKSGLRLETRVRWNDPKQHGVSLLFQTEPVSVRLISGKDIVWEHVY